MNSQHIGAAGELLVQYQLLKFGIDSARLTTDAGVDLVVYSPGDQAAHTIQVKTNLGPKPAGGHGPLSRSWYFPHECAAQLLALVALDTDAVWLLTLEQAQDLAQQHSERGMRQLYWRLEAEPAAGKSLRHEAEMTSYLIANRALELFPS
jgi:hypothetical protein